MDQEAVGYTGLKIFFYLCIFSVIYYVAGINEDSLLITTISIIGASFLYFFYYILSEGKFWEMVAGVALAIFIVFICSTTIFLLPLLLIYVLSQIKSMWETIKSLFPDVVISGSMWGCIYGHYKYFDSTLVEISMVVIYGAMALGYTGLLMERPLKQGLLKLSIMIMSAPLCAVLFAAIFSSLRTMFQTTITSATHTVKTTQKVAGYMKGDKIISDYTRNVSKEVTKQVATTTAGSGGSVAGSVNSLTKNAKRE